MNLEVCPKGRDNHALNPITLHILVENTCRQENYFAHRQETIAHLISIQTPHWLQVTECIGRYVYAAKVSSLIQFQYMQLVQVKEMSH